MQIDFLGSAQEVGRSSILLRGSQNIMLDCGLKIHSEEAYPLAAAEEPDFVIASHAHLDHTGFLPALYKRGAPEFLCTPPTLALGKIIIEDSINIMAKRGEFPFKPSHLKKMEQNATKLSYKKRYSCNDATVIFYDAGHIPGAAIIDVEIDGKRIVYTGDFKGEATRTTYPCELPPKEPDVLIIESTYSDRDHPPRKELEKQLAENIESVLENGGNILFPAFAIGRTQELVRIIRSINKDVEVYVDGMGWRVSQELSRYSAYVKDFKKFREDLQTCIPIMHKRERRKVLRKPCIIIATAGMLQGGPALSYLLQLSPQSMAIFTGYCVEGTNGHNLLNFGFVEYDGVKLKPKAQYAYLDFSAHAGRRELFEMCEKLRPQRIFCVHGDKCQEFAEELKLEGFDAYAPVLGETVEVE
ncbi:MAG: MBL fold metallo-hydrolase [Candidatus Micrarchaeota archaeon]|nr:MBL fold metallo-hydrolase [Candidatus Micrarchaeota archaeon]